MPLRFLLFFLLTCSLGATEYLKSNYFVTNDFVMLSDVINEPQEDAKLYVINPNRHTKRIKAKELLQKLKTHGYKEYASKHNYIQFSKKSPINTNYIATQIKKYYQKKYLGIKIDSLIVSPRAYMEKLPAEYEFGIDKKEYLSHQGICFIKTKKNKKIFFNYEISATVDVYISRVELKRAAELSNLNTQKKSIILDKFRAAPLQKLEAHTLEAKHKLKAGTILTKRDVTGLYLVKRGSNVSVTLNEGGISISFSAKAVTSGRYGDTITVLKSDQKKIKVRVSGKNRAEM